MTAQHDGLHPRIEQQRSGRPAKVVRVDVERAKGIIRRAQAAWRIGDAVRPPRPPAGDGSDS